MAAGHRFGWALGAALVAAGVAQAQSIPGNFVDTYADQDQFGDGTTTLGSGVTATVLPTGIRATTNGSRFFNVQGPGSSFSSWGGIRLDLSELYSFLNGQIGTGGVVGWQIDAADLVLTQSLAAFSTAGALHVSLSQDDTTDLDPYTAAGTLAGTGAYAGELGALSFVNSYAWAPVANGALDMIDISSVDVLNELNNTMDQFMTLVLEAPTAGTAITLKGQDSPFGGLNAPYLTIEYTLFIPTPGAGALFGLAGLAAMRRRRA